MKKLLSIILLIAAFGTVSGQTYPDQPNPPRLVNDYTSTLAQGETEQLEKKLRNYYDSTSTQIAIVMLNTLEGYPIDDYAINLAKKWGVGEAGKNNGVLILVSKYERKIFIANGYGMEGVLTDGRTKRIIEQDIKPSFKEGRFHQGLDKGVDRIIQLASGEFVAEDEKTNAKDLFGVFIGLFSLIVIGLILQARKVKHYATINNIPFWTAWQLLSTTRVPHRGYYGGFNGGSSGGGFSGFGGGGFGGGGAGGSW